MSTPATTKKPDEKPAAPRLRTKLTELQVMSRIDRMLGDLNPLAAKRVLTWLIELTNERLVAARDEALARFIPKAPHEERP